MKSRNYWTTRFKALENRQNQTAAQTYAQIEPAFDKAQVQIQKEIEYWYQRIADNNEISLADAQKLLSKNELKEFHWSVEEYIKHGRENAVDPKWMKELENASAKFHISRLEALKVNTQQQLEVAFGNQLDGIDQMARNVYQDEYYRTAFEIMRGNQVGFNIGTIDTKKLDQLIKKPWTADGSNFSDRVWANKNQMVNALHQEMTRSFIVGGTPDDAIAAMTAYLADKTTNAKHKAARLVQTEQAYFSSAAQKDCFKDLDVEEFEIVASLDAYTCEICGAMDGQHASMDVFQAGVTAPPFHPFCRCTTVPYFNDEWSGGERAARGEDGKTYYVPADIKYSEWIKQFSGTTPTVDYILKMASTTPFNLHPKKNTVPIDKEEIDAFNSSMKALGIETKGFETYCGSSKMLKDISNKYEILSKIYPEEIKGMKLHYTVDADEGTFGWVDINGVIHLNKFVFDDSEFVQASYEHAVSIGRFPLGTDCTSVVFHEFGHQYGKIHNINIKQVVKDVYYERHIGEVGQYGNLKQYRNMLVNELSINSVSVEKVNPFEETLADAFAEWYTSSNPRSLCEEILRKAGALK